MPPLFEEKILHDILATLTFGVLAAYDDTMGPFFFRGCSECDSVRATYVVSMQFQETFGDTYVTASERDMHRFFSASRRG